MNDFLISKKVKLNEAQKDFVFIFFQTNSLTTTKNYLNLPIDEVVKIYKDPLIQDILRQLQLYRHREIFKTKMLNLEEIGSFLSSQLLDLNVGESDRLNPREKLEATKLLLEVHSKINNVINNPIELNSYQILDMQFKDLSISTIRSLLHKKSNGSPTKNYLQNNNNNDDDDVSFLKQDKFIFQQVDEISKKANLEHLDKRKEKIKEGKDKIEKSLKK